MAKPTVLIHGRYTIRAGVLNGKPTARAFLTGARQGSGFQLEEVADTVELAIDAARTALNTRDADARAERRQLPNGWAVPTQAEFQAALSGLGGSQVSEAQMRMLLAHAHAGDKGLTASELAEAAGYVDYSAANLQYGKLGAEIAAYLGAPLPPSELRAGLDVATGVLAVSGTPRDDGSFVWVMHRELRDALRTPA